MAEFGIVGLGRMGGGLARQALGKGFRVAGFARKGLGAELRRAGIVDCASLGKLVGALARPRIVFLYVPAGRLIDDLVDRLPLDRGDLLADGGNSYWGDGVRRHRDLRERGIDFVDLGTSGGVEGARTGACFMAGGDDDAVARIEPILKSLAVPGGYAHAGGPGAGHYAKLVHNGIEFGMLQAIGEGVELLHRHPQALRVADVLSCWRNGSVIRSWLIDLMEESYRNHTGLKGIPSFVEDTGEVNWLVGDALRLECPIPVIAQAVMQLFASRDPERLSARAVAMMRNGFGGHPFGPDEGIARERREGKVGDSIDKPRKLRKVANHRRPVQGRRRSRLSP